MRHSVNTGQREGSGPTPAAKSLPLPVRRPSFFTATARDDPSAAVRGTVAEVFFQSDHVLVEVCVGAQSFLVAISEGALSVGDTSAG